MTPLERDREIIARARTERRVGTDLAREYNVSLGYICALLNRPPPVTSKYRARPTVVDGIRFDSKAEATRYVALREMESAGIISRLELQPRFTLHAKGGAPVCVYVADFAYTAEDGRRHVEDVKSDPTATALFRLKRKLFLAEYPTTPLHIIDSHGRERGIIDRRPRKAGSKRKARA